MSKHSTSHPSRSTSWWLLTLALFIIGCGGASSAPPTNTVRIAIADRVNARIVNIGGIPATNWTQLQGSVSFPELQDELMAIVRHPPGFYVLTRAGRIVRFNNMSGGGYTVHPADLPDGEGDLHVSATGEMYVTRAATGELWYFSNWSSTPSAPSQTIPGAWLLKLSVGANGRIFMSDQQNSRIYEMASPTSTPNIVIDGANLVLPADMSSPAGLHYDQTGNRLLICDSDRDTIDIYDFGTMSYSNGTWNIPRPIDIHLGTNGQWYFTYVTGVATVTNIVTGAGYQTYGSFGSGQGQFAEPWSIVAYAP